MQSTSFIQLLTGTVALLGAYYSLRSAVTLSDNQIAQIASTRWDYNLAVLQSLARQRAEAIIGLAALLMVLILQVATVGQNFPPFRSPAVALIVLTVLLGVLIATGAVVHRRLVTRFERAALAALKDHTN